ncbi:MAG TPA: type VI secretion system-associated FHA domain protein TagH [Steroidobacteraceae bacterium]
MALQLRIISDHRRLLGDRSSVVFDSAGGNIGRSTDNDWVLPDPQRFVSAHHARVHFRDGMYILEDTSTNGVFINDEERPVAKRGAHVLQNGDILRFGEYQVVAMVEAGSSGSSGSFAGTGSSSVEVHTSAQSVEVLAAVGQAAQTDLGAALDLGELLQSDAADFRRPVAVNAYGQPVRAFTPQSVPSPAELSASLADSETERRAIARRIERLARAASRAQDRRAAANPPVAVDANNGLSAFCKGAGIAADHFAPELQVRLLQLAGQLIREALVGLKDLERARTEALRPMQIDTPANTDDPRPSLARAGVEDLLVEILNQHESRRLDAVQWLREVLDRAKAHDRATFDALHTAFVDFVARLDPAELESRFGRPARSAADGGARNWELYNEFYRSIAAKADGQLPRVFLDAFSAAYEKNLQHPDK